ncbi:MAG: hypothetical protein HYR96_03260 [Deltaproteobacteria bacterium]|nr:hypothetical protein [Deltaproteobacteria bacterium]MBI3294298.1 hypothetical protein [Deltaproteobacteria bacterium]
MEDKALDKPWWNELIREMALSGLATVFMTEDMVRNQLKDLKLPKELLGAILDGVGKKKEDLYATFGREFGKVLSKVDLTQEMARFLETHKVDIQMKLSFEAKPEDKT